MPTDDALNQTAERILARIARLPDSTALTVEVTELSTLAKAVLRREAAPGGGTDTSWEKRAGATGGGPCPICGKPYFTHVCLSCSLDYQTPGPGCVNCRHSGMDQTPCRPVDPGPKGESDG